MASLNQDVIGRIPISLPPLPEQRAIARILGALDDKIELNRKMNATLEAMARALFKSWFVDFDPVRAKAEGRAPSGMDAETARLFPSEFVESELGPIPKGWRVSKLGDLLELKRGYDLPASQRSPGGVPIVSSSGPTGVHDEAKVAGPGIVTGRCGTIGQVFLVREDFWPLNTTLYARDLKGTQLSFAYHMLCGLDFQKFSDKAAVPGINRNHVHEERVVAAPEQIQRRFEQIAEPWAKQREQHWTESRLLVRLRDELLPRLLSGELSVAEAEQVEAMP
jgi:type I restriction enzyme S subunit